MTTTPPDDPISAILDGGAGPVLAGPIETRLWRFVRTWTAVVRYEDHGGAPGDLEQALTGFESLPWDVPGLSRLAAVLMRAAVRTSATSAQPPLLDPRQRSRLRNLLRAAGSDPVPVPDWPQVLAAFEAVDTVVAMVAVAGAGPASSHDALVKVGRLMSVVGDAEPYAAVVGLMHDVLSHAEALRDDPAATAATAEFGRLLDRAHRPSGADGTLAERFGPLAG
ncbi:hypothetical protein [Catenulispora rubra]|uniref:hypothetical protein n=1 Tax=Catenulispora rubra TaxID=280293 RepID=UPI00189269DD|nr:hypothetical protein [Catenulispora rubra]